MCFLEGFLSFRFYVICPVRVEEPADSRQHQRPEQNLGNPSRRSSVGLASGGGGVKEDVVFQGRVRSETC